jgi:hypothetical protein
MLIRHLVVGVVVGALAALGSGLMGFSIWAVVGFYILGGNLGLGLSVLAGLVPWPERAGRTSSAVWQVSRSATGTSLAE